MPIFEFKCKKCGEVFELLVRANEKPACPKCKGKRLEKLISTFNAGSQKCSRKRLSSRKCCGDAGGCCSGGGCCGGCSC